MQLLAHLAVRQAWQSRDDLARLFWPDRESKTARSNLRNLLCKTVAAAPFATIESTEHALRLKAPTDLDELDAAIRLQDWQAAVRIGASDLLQGMDNAATEPYLSWLRTERDECLARWKQAIGALLAQTSQPVEQRRAWAEAWALRCPLDEDAVQALVGLAHERQQPAAALAHYRAFEARLRDELDVRPSVGLERLALQAVPPHAAAAHAWTTQGLAGAPLFGRRLEMRQLMSLLGDGSTQLITVTGPGGVGKSTLLAGLHRHWIDDGGVDSFLIDVSATTSAAAALAAIAFALGAKVPAGAPEDQILADALGERRWLLLIDGAEQPGLATPLAQLLRRCPLTRWVLASRQRLHLDSEQLLVLDGFPLPDADEEDTELLGANDAVRFLADTVAKAGSPVNMSRDAPSMAAIVRAVDGLPLALKLLGKLTPLFSLNQLLDHLRQQPRSDALHADSLKLAELFPALLVSFERSWLSLSAAEQTLLARLAVFTADFSVEAARRVGKAELPLITALIDRSLLRADGSGRLSLHAAIRSCVQALCPQPSADAVADYIDYYTQALRRLAGVAMARTVRPLRLFLEAEKPQLDAVWAHGVTRRDYAALQGIQESVWFIDVGENAITDYSSRCVEAERTIRGDPVVPPALRALLLAGMARHALNQGRWPQSSELGRDALRAAQRARHFGATAWALVNLVLATLLQRQLEQALPLMDRLQTLLQHVQEGALATIVPQCRAVLAHVSGDDLASLEHFERCATVSNQIEDRDAEIFPLSNMVYIHYMSGRPDRAEQCEQRLLAAGSAAGADPSAFAGVLSGLTHWHIRFGKLERARAVMARVDALSYRHPHGLMTRMRVRLGHAAVLTAEHKLAAAREQLVEMLDAASHDEAFKLSNRIFLVTALWFREAGAHEPFRELLRILRLKTASAFEFRMLRTLLPELDDVPPAEPAELGARVRAAAALARQRMMQLVFQMD